jgi:YidC/Oxa1 family membrane protein insertase
MISTIWNTIIYEPLYNGFIFLTSTLPFFDLGVIVVIFTLIVKFVLLPLSIKATKTQQAVKLIEPEINKIKEKHKKDKQAQATATMDLYKQHNIKPFSGFLLIFIQLPIIFALYYIFLKGGFPEVNTDILYSFISAPSHTNHIFLGLIDVTKKSIVLALLTGITQFFHTTISLPKIEKRDKGFGQGSFKDDFAHTMKLQMKYALPLFVAFISYTLSAAIALYWTTSNIFHILQELYVKKHITNKPPFGTETATQSDK